MKETLGQYLRRKRESRLISLQEISHSTGISVPVITALEENDFHLIPKPEMITKYLKKYAAYLKLNKQDVLKRYQTQRELTHQKKLLFPRISRYSEGNTSFKQLNREKRLFKKRFTEGIFWSGIILWALAIFFLYIHVLSPKTETPDTQEKFASKDVRKEASHERNALIPSVASEKPERPPVRAASRSEDRSALTPSRNVIPLERDSGAKEAGTQAQKIPLPGKAKVIGNRDSKRYHLPGMEYYNKVKLYHRVIFNSETEAIKAGYSKARD
jgi:cytoskeletal protein RodZ